MATCGWNTTAQRCLSWRHNRAWFILSSRSEKMNLFPVCNVPPPRPLRSRRVGHCRRESFRRRRSAEAPVLRRKPATCNLQPATCNLQPATCNLQPATCNVQPATCNLQPATRNLQPATCNLQPATCNLQPSTCNVQRRIPRHLGGERIAHTQSINGNQPDRACNEQVVERRNGGLAQRRTLLSQQTDRC